MLFKFFLPLIIKKLTTIYTFIPNFKLCIQTNRKLCYQTREGFMKVVSLTWLQTTNHLKYYTYHIRHSNMVCLSSSKNLLQGAPSNQILSFATKPVGSCFTKPKRVCEISLKLQALNIIPTHFHSLKTTTNVHSILLLSTIY